MFDDDFYIHSNEGEEDSLVVSTRTEFDEIENILRPKSMDGYVGQEKVKNNLAVYMQAAKLRNEPLDHVSAECELMSYLAYRACEEALGTAADQSMPVASAQAAYDAFCVEHARAWMPQFADELEQASELAFYRVTAKMLRAVATVSIDR